MHARLLSTLAAGRTLLSWTALYTRRLLRFFHLHLITQLTKWRRPQEDAKVILFANRGIALLSTLLHLVPLATVLALITMNARPTYIGEVSTATITTLQFAAKVLEILIQASIAAIVLGIIRQQVIASPSFPLGGFLVPYRVTDVSFLCSLELWGFISSTGFRVRHKLALLLTVVLSVVLAALVGPSSAIAMIPRQITVPTGRLLIFLPEQSLFYPMEVTLVDGKLSNEASLEMDFEQLAVFSSQLPQSIIDNLTDYSYRTMTISAEDNFPVLSSAVTLPHQANTLPLLYSNNSNNENAKIRTALQPYVSQTCYFQFYDSRNLSSTYISFEDNEPEFKNVLSLANLASMNPGPASEFCQDFAWLSLYSAYNDTDGMIWCGASSRGANYSLLTVYFFNQTIPQPGITYVGSAMACVVRAHWIQSTVKLTVSSNTIANTDIIEYRGAIAPKGTNANTSKSSGSDQTSSTTIRISAEWAKKVTELFVEAGQIWQTNPGYLISNTLFASALSDIGPDYGKILLDSVNMSTNFYPQNLPPQQDTWFSKKQYDSFVAFLAKQGNPGGYDFILIYAIDQNWTDADSLTMFDVEYSLPGYGYDTSQVTVKLSLAVLATYASIAVVYLVYIVMSGRVGTSWDSIGELVMLCLNSKPPSHLQGTGAGVETIATYGKMMNVRINKARAAEISFADDPAMDATEYTLVDVNKKYY